MASCKSPICLLSVLLTMLLIDPCFNYNFFNPASDDCVVAIRNRTQIPPGLHSYVDLAVRQEQQAAAQKADVFRNTFTADCVPFGEFGHIWGGFWGCLTFTCKDGNGKDIFRVNGCARDNEKKCPAFFYTFCRESGGNLFNCRHCDELVDGKVCNSFDAMINLDQSEEQMNSIYKSQHSHHSNSSSTSKAEKLGPASAFTWISTNLLLLFALICCW
ncbi:hypothetical protein niasHT_037381 [Heterodera trifolii]|uniref:Uncharacterized protein n=1 Tax=Heterodera trifolii TaxID=157864 RepID=A0ABD2J4V1_9BILA